MHWELASEVLSMIRAKHYDVVVTHMPFSALARWTALGEDPAAYYNAVYGVSVGIVKRIREESPQTKIIIYTGADHNAVITSLFSRVSDCIVQKSSDWQRDAHNLAAEIARLVNEDV